MNKGGGLGSNASPALRTGVQVGLKRNYQTSGFRQSTPRFKVYTFIPQEIGGLS